MPSVRSQSFNILRYVHGQHYEAHMDTFDPKEFGPQPTNRVSEAGGVSQVLFVLSRRCAALGTPPVFPCMALPFSLG